MTYWSYHSRTSVHRYISLFFVIIFFLACLSFVANSPLNAVFTFTLQRLALVRTPYYQRLLKTAAARCSLHWLSHRSEHNSRTRRWSFAKSLLSLAYSPSMCTKRSSNCVYPRVAQSSLSLIIWCLCLTADTGHDKVFEQCSLKVLIASLQRNTPLE